MDGRSKLKEACQRRPLTKAKRCQQNYTKYMDGMQEALNTNVQENVMPYWRDHNSLKGRLLFYFLTVLCIRLVLNELSVHGDQPYDKKETALGR